MLISVTLSGQGSIEWIVIVALVVAVLIFVWYQGGLCNAITSMWNSVTGQVESLSNTIACTG